MNTDEPYNSSLDAAEDYQDQIDTLLADNKRLREENTRLKNGDNWNAVVLDMADMISDSCMSKARFDAARYYCHKGECRTDWNDGLCPICEDGEEE